MSDALTTRVAARLEEALGVARPALAAHPDRTLVYRREDGHESTPEELGRIMAEVDQHGTVKFAWPRSLWPKDLPLPLTTATALARVTVDLPRLATELAAEIASSVAGLVEPGLAAAVTDRPLLAERWPMPVNRDGGWMALCTVLSAGGAGEKGPAMVQWPGEVAPREVAEWAKDAANRLVPGYGDALVSDAQADRMLAGISFERDGREITLPGYALALIYMAWKDVEQGRRRPAVAIDAARPNHELLSGWRGIPKDTRKGHDFRRANGRIELLNPEQGCIQLTLDFPDEGLSEAMVRALKNWRGWKGLRNWAALQRLLSVEGGREGWVRWTLDAHMEALGYSPKERARLATQERIAQEVELFTKLELAVYDDSGKLRERRPLVHVGSKFDRLKGSRWVLDGMELRINPLLYQGVRDPRTGELGSNYGLAPPELAQVNHIHHPHTLALGLILPIRWRMAWGDEKDHVRLAGESLLRLAGVAYTRHDAARAWAALDRDLEELRRIGGLGRWQWQGERDTLASVVRLYPAEWMRDRIERGITPLELPPAPAVATGGELRTWREAKGLSQTAAATALHVSERTVRRAETRTAEPLGPALRRALTAVR